MSFISTGGYSSNELFDQRYKLSYKDIDYDLVQQFPENWCLNKMIMPISIENGVIRVATNNANQNTIHEIAKYAKFKNIEIIERDASCILDLINETYQVNETWNEFIDKTFQNEHCLIEKFADRLMADAVRKKASDIHILPCENCIKFKYRIAGRIEDIFQCHKKYFQKILVYLKVLFGVDITSSFKSRDASINKTILSAKVNIRISFHRCINGEKIAIRLINHVPNTCLSNIGYSEHVHHSITRILKASSGIICFVGPTGSGKTTSMYSCLSEIDLNRFNVMTVEDPVEMYIDSISQTNVNDHPDMNFVDCLKSIMRQDPDVIVIGEIRDNETAAMALRAAMSGHKVFTTLHAKNIISAIERFCDLGVSKKTVIDNIAGIVAQRLIRSKCTGEYHTRVVSEAICLDKSLRSVLYQHDALSDSIAMELFAKGFKTMFDDGIDLVNKGLIAYEELESIVECDNK